MKIKCSLVGDFQKNKLWLCFTSHQHSKCYMALFQARTGTLVGPPTLRKLATYKILKSYSFIQLRSGSHIDKLKKYVNFFHHNLSLVFKEM